MRPARLRLRVLLVLCLVMVPGVLSLVTWRLIQQERELEVVRLGERRALLVAQISQQMLLVLERERQREVSPDAPLPFGVETEPFLLSAPLTGEGLELPWDDVPRTGWGETEIRGLIRSAEELEFRQRRSDLAAVRYAQAADAAESPVSRVDATLREARARRRAGQSVDALDAYRRVSQASPELIDDEGMPYALYGAEGLLLGGPPDDALLGVLESVATAHGITQHRAAEVPRLSPIALYMLRDLTERVLDDLEAGAAAESTRELAHRARAVHGSLTAQIGTAERLLVLRRDVPTLLAMVQGSDGATGLAASNSAPLAAAWLPYGSPPWLIGVSERPEGTRLLVADPDRVLAALPADAAGARDAVLEQVTLTTVPQTGAELLGPSFPGLFAVLSDTAVPPARGSDLSRLLLFVVLPLVLATTAVAALLVWRDVQREIATADLRAQFVSSVSHELKTPLTSIRMFAETLLLGRRPGVAETGEYLATIVNESERLTRLIDNVLDFSRIDRGERVYHMAPTSLDEVLRGAARAMSYPLEQGGFELRVTTPPSSPVAEVDGDALTQAVLNLLSNAVKFSEDERVIELELALEGDEALIRVRDHGRGIEARAQSLVFERFFRADDARGDGIPGTGLGLALVDHVARAHGGLVELDSTPGAGSTFTIRLPIRSAPS